VEDPPRPLEHRSGGDAEMLDAVFVSDGPQLVPRG
jgi:hypothetical protein